MKDNNENNQKNAQEDSEYAVRTSNKAYGYWVYECYRNGEFVSLALLD